MNVYVTVFDQGYVVRATALACSFGRHCKDDLLLLACLDTESAEILAGMNLPGTRVVWPDTFVAGELLDLKSRRSRAEFCWTTKPYLLEYILANLPSAEWAVYLDTDSMIFGPISEALEASPEPACVLTPHNFASEFEHYEESVGRFNAGFVAIRNSDQGRKAVTEWRELCADSVSAVPTENAYGDQKYLDELATKWCQQPDAAHQGLNVAPWNVGNYLFDIRADRVFVDGVRLCFYHFQGFLQITSNLLLLYRGVYPLPKFVRKHVYRPYLAELRHARRLVISHGGSRFLDLSIAGLIRSAHNLWIARRNAAVTWNL